MAGKEGKRRRREEWRRPESHWKGRVVQILGASPFCTSVFSYYPHTWEVSKSYLFLCDVSESILPSSHFSLPQSSPSLVKEIFLSFIFSSSFSLISWNYLLLWPPCCLFWTFWELLFPSLLASVFWLCHGRTRRCLSPAPFLQPFSLHH